MLYLPKRLCLLVDYSITWTNSVSRCFRQQWLLCTSDSEVEIGSSIAPRARFACSIVRSSASGALSTTATSCMGAEKSARRWRRRARFAVANLDVNGYDEILRRCYCRWDGGNSKLQRWRRRARARRKWLFFKCSSCGRNGARRKRQQQTVDSEKIVAHSARVRVAFYLIQYA